MRSRITTLLTVLGGVAVLVLASNTVALAATGHGLRVGRANGTSHTTTISRSTHGPALTLLTKSRFDAPLAVNGTGRVRNLNADEVDGLDSSQLRSRTFVFTAAPFENVSGVAYTLPLHPGSYLLTYTSFFSAVEPGGVECFATVLTDDTEQETAYSSLVHTASNSWAPSLTGSGLVTKTAHNTVRVICETQGSRFSSSDDVPLRITATPTQVASSKTLHADPLNEAIAPQ